MANTQRREAHEHKRGVASPRLVKLLGADARLAENDEPEPIDRGPLTQPAELTEADWIAADVAEDQGKAERRNRINDAAAIELQLVEFRARGYV